MGIRGWFGRQKQAIGEKREQRKMSKAEEKAFRAELERIRTEARREAMKQAVKKQARILAREEAIKYVRKPRRVSMGGIRSTLATIGERASRMSQGAAFNPFQLPQQEKKPAVPLVVGGWGNTKQPIISFNPFSSPAPRKRTKKRRKEKTVVIKVR